MNRIHNYKVYFLKLALMLFLTVGIISFLPAQTTVTRLFDDAAELVENGRYKLAVAKYDSVLNYQATNPKLFYNRALAYIYMQKYGPALVDLNKCISIDSVFYDAYFNRAYVHQLLKNSAFALGDYNIFIAQYPDDHEAKFARGKILLQENNYKEAIGDISFYTHKVNTNEDAYLALFFAYKKLGENEKALASIDTAVELKKLSPSLNKIKADFLFDLGKFEEAAKSYDRAIESHRSNTDLYVSKAEAKFKVGLYNDAVAAMEKAINYAGDNPNHFYDKAFYLMQAKRHQESNKAIKKAIELKYADSATAYFISAINFNNLGFAKDACLNFKKALALGKLEAKEYVAKLCD